MTDSQRTYRLDGVEIDALQVSLKRDGQEQHLRQKTFQVLVYLIENRPRVVPKDELIEHIWAGAAVTDNTLEQCLAEIRKALGDDSRHPRFIKTVPRAGYRVIGMVEEISVGQSAAAGSNGAAHAVPTSAAEASTAAARVPDSGKPFLIGRRSIFLGLSLVLVVAGLGTIYGLRQRPASDSLAGIMLNRDPDKRTVAVMFFDNESHSEDLDWLREGLADMIITDLSRSNSLSVLSRQHLHALLERAGHRDVEKISLDEALAVAHQSQANIFMLGSFARLGTQIRIDVHLHEAQSGQLLTAERMVVDQPAEILTKVDLLSLKLASYLSARPSQEAGAGLSGVMTNNLEAYRYYSLGLEKAHAVQTTEAIDSFQKAVALDPQFAMAQARIGYTYAVTWDRVDEGKPYLQKAFQLSSRLTDKDKLYITGWYAIANHDYAAATKTFQDIVTRYPLEIEAYIRLGRLLRGEERYDEAIEVMKQGLVIDPGAKDLYNSLGSTYSDLGRHDEAISMFQRYVELAGQEANAHDSLGGGYQWAGRYAEAIQEYQRALRLKPDFEIAVIHLGNTYFQLGRYRDAIAQYQHYIQLARADGERARGYNGVAYVQLKLGQTDQARRSAEQARRYEKGSVEVLFYLALNKSDFATAAKLREVIEGVQSAERGMRSSSRPLLYYRGYFELRNGQADQAIAEFKQALNHHPQWWNTDALEDCLANGYLESGKLDEAIKEYKRILVLNPNYPLLHYHLAQVYERKGQEAQARAEYRQFLQVWINADPDIPEVVLARKALAP